jgi:ABC-2 type transport system ATP-binding protein
MSIKVTGISKSYGKQLALDNVSFEVRKGEVVGLLGPNGAGKSTLMKIITGYIEADKGSVEICGVDAFTDPMQTRRMIGYLPEHNPLYLDMFVREYLTMVADIYRKPAQSVSDMIEFTGLTPEAHKKIGQLSKGYRQRVGLAQALLCEPEIIILDEPTTGLDPNQIIEIRNLIRAIGKERTVIMSTHLMQEVEAVCDRVVIISKGVIRAEGSAAQIAQTATCNRVVEVEFVERPVNIPTLGNALNVEVEALTDTSYRIVSTDDVRAQLFRWAVDNDAVIIKMVNVDSDMEHIFHELTTRT